MNIAEAIQTFKDKDAPKDAPYLFNKYDYEVTYISYPSIGEEPEEIWVLNEAGQKFIRLSNDMVAFWWVRLRGTSNLVGNFRNKELIEFKDNNEPELIAIRKVAYYVLLNKQEWFMDKAIKEVDTVYGVDFFSDQNTKQYILKVQSILSRGIKMALKKSWVFPSYWSF